MLLSTFLLSTSQEQPNSTTVPMHVERARVLKSIRSALEGYSDELVRRILDSAANQQDLGGEEGRLTTSPPTTSTTLHTAHVFHDELEEQLREEEEATTSGIKKPPVFRLRADLRSSSAQEDERPLTRHHRSARHGGGAAPTAASDWPFGHHHRRRRKGCPPLHGKEQLLCPSRNAHRYDVCISREQICDHTADCPNGEDESETMCFFYKPLDDQLKTLSHAVLLLVDNVMSEQKKQEL